jgi:hypothetical protein
MINRCELITLHISDLLEMIDADPGGEGSLVLMVNGEEAADVDLTDLCLIVKLDTGVAQHRRETIPLLSTGLSKL